MPQDKVFPTGMYASAPREGAPDFVKGRVSFKVADFTKFLATQEDEWLNVDIKQGREGKWYAQVDTWKPKQAAKKADAEEGGDGLPF